MPKKNVADVCCWGGSIFLAFCVTYLSIVLYYCHLLIIISLFRCFQQKGGGSILRSFYAGDLNNKSNTEVGARLLLRIRR
jgi:hypothetical protein